MAKAHYLQALARQIDKTHPRLGSLVAITLVAIKAKKCLLVVSPSGCGKSASVDIVSQAYAKVMRMDGISMAALGSVAQELTGFDGVIVVDDISKNQTTYSRRSAITTLAELIYSHYVERHFHGSEVSLTDFRGAGVINIQPVMLRELVISDEWEASVQDKTLRYYHIFRPLEPNLEVPKIELDMGVDLAEVAEPGLKGKLARKLFLIGQVQWSRARVLQHIKDLLKATAALDKRDKVNQSDLKVLLRLLRPMRLEQWALSKSAFETGRRLNSNALAILTEFATYGNFSLEQLSLDYKVAQSTAYRLMMNQQRDWIQVSKSPTVYAPTEGMRERLEELGLA